MGIFGENHAAFKVGGIDWLASLCPASPRSLILCFSMGSRLGIFSWKWAYAKVIHCHLISSLCVPRDFKVCYIWLKWRGISKVWLFVEMGRGFLICSLLMIVYYFVGLKRRNAERFWICWLFMREVRGRKLIETKLIFFSALILLICSLVFKAFWGVSAIRQYEKYLGLLHLWEGPRSKVLSISRKGFGKNFRGGRKSCCLKQAWRF